MKAKKSRNSYMKITKTGSNSPGGPFDEDVLADIDGGVRVDTLVLVDRSTGKDWEVYIKDGVLVYEPMDLGEKRDFKINRIIKNGDK